MNSFYNFNNYNSILVRTQPVKEKYIKIIEKIHSIGGSIYLVGGKIRDSFLYIDNNDIDFCIAQITPESFMELFPEAKMTGHFFPVFHLADAEFAFARKDKKISEGHNGFEVISDTSITIEEDLARRDITINAMAINMKDMMLIDPFNGLEDLKIKTIRHVDADAFKDDPLRVYRVARFAATLDLSINRKTYQIMSEMKDSLSELSSERVYSEMHKALSSSNPRHFFDVLKFANVLSVHFPEIADLNDNVYEHSMRALEASVNFTTDVSVRYAILLHDIGKGVLPIPYKDHDKEGVALIKKLSRRLKTPRRMEKMAEMVAAQHMKALKFPEMRPGKKLRLLMVASNIKGGINALVAMVLSDSKACEVPLGFDFCSLKKAMNIFKEVTGADIFKKYPGVKGKAFGIKLFQERAQYLSLKTKEVE